MRFRILFIICLSVTIKITAQRYPFREYSVVDGLPQSQATKLVQDKRGFIWIVTRNGLSRFDGLEFVNYFRKNGLPTNGILDIIEDTSGIILTLSKSGLSKYTGNSFVTYPVPESLHDFSPTSIISRDSNNNFYILWNGPDKEKDRIILFKDGQYIEYGKKYPALDTMHIIYMRVDKPSDVIIIGDSKNYLWAWKDSALKSLRSTPVDMIFDDIDGSRFVSNDSLYYYYNGQLRVFDFRKTPKESYVLYNKDQLSREVLLYYNKRNFRINLPFNYTGYFVDNEGVLWLTSEGNLNRLLSTSFNTFSENDIGAPNIWAITEDRNGHILIGTLYNTLIEYDGIKFTERKEWRSLYKGPIGFFKGSRVMSDGDTWISTSNGVLIWNGSTFSVLKGLPDLAQICYIYEDPDNKVVMLGTQMGLFILKNGKIELLSRFNDNDLGVIEGVAKDDYGTYWLSGHKGVLKFDGTTALPLKEDVLSQAFTYTIVKDSYGGLWVTSEEGLFFRAKDANAFIPGLPEDVNKSANSILVIDSTHIITGRPADVCLIDLKKFYNKERDYFRIYDKNDGFEGKDCIDNGLIKDRNGKLWVLTSSNVVFFDPEKLKINNNPPEIRLTGFNFQTDRQSWQPVDSSRFFYKIPDNLKLNRRQNKIQFTFTGISYTNPENVKLQYRLTGYDDIWSIPSAKRTQTYDNLPPGNYSFEIKGANADGIETPEPFRISFRIVPAFWQTTVFLIGVFTLIVALSVFITLFIMRRYQLKLKEKERARSEFSRLQMTSVLKQFDPHFTFNVISSVGSLIMKGEKEIAYDYITKLSSLLRTLLSDGTMILRSLSDELDFVRRYCDLQKLRFKDRFNFNIIIDEDVDLQKEIPKMLIQTFVENSLKHGFENRLIGGKVVISINKNETGVEISITDNGIGRKAASKYNSKGTGQGLKIINDFFEVMNGNNLSKSTLKISDLEDYGRPAGTKVSIYIPDDYRFEFRGNEKY